MVIRILTGKDVAGVVRYNEKKVGEGLAQRIEVANYPNKLLAEKNSDFRLQLLEQQVRLNPGIRKPSVHLAIAFHPTEIVSDSQLQRIGREIMQEAGFGQQPYLVYRHTDTLHPHMHIVSVSIGPDGRKISDQFIKTRLNKIRRGIEQRHNLIKAEEVTKSQIAATDDTVNRHSESLQNDVNGLVKQTVETYSFGSIESFQEYLRLKNVQINLATGRSKSGITFQMIREDKATTRLLRASELDCKPTYTRLMNRFSGHAEQHKKQCEDMITSMSQRLSQYEKIMEQDYKTTLQQIGIEVFSRGGGYIYVQQRSGVVAQEVELPDRFRKQNLLKQFSAKTVRVESNRPKLNKGQDEKSSESLKNQSAPLKSNSNAEDRSLFSQQTMLQQAPVSNSLVPKEALNKEAKKQKHLNPEQSQPEAGLVKTHRGDEKKMKKNNSKKRPRL